MRILRLPESLHRYFEEGVVGLGAERPLREVAKLSPRIAECVCEVAKRDKVKPSRFVDEFEDLLDRVPETKFDDPPTLIPAFRATLEELVPEAEARRQLVERLKALWPGQKVDGDLYIHFTTEEVDQARAAHVLLEYKGPGHRVPSRYICDAEYAADMAVRWVDRKEKQVKRERKEIEKAEKEAAAARGGADPSAGAEELAAERKKAEAKRRREETKKRKERARKVTFNDDIGRKISRRHGKRSAQRAAARFGVIADLLFDAYPELGDGVRLVLGQLREIDGEDITYATICEAIDYLRDRVARADSVEEKIELVIQAIVADQIADRGVLPVHESWRGHSVVIPEDTVPALEPEIKALTPTTEAGGR